MSNRANDTNLGAARALLTSSIPRIKREQHAANDLVLSTAEVLRLLEFIREDTGAAESEHLLEGQIAAYCQDDPSAEAVERIERHLASCDRCALKVEQRLLQVGRTENHEGQNIPRLTSVHNENAACNDPVEKFYRLFEGYRRPIYCFFRKKGFSHDCCADLVQQTFLRVHCGLEQLRSEASSRSWIFQIATNVWRNEIRRRLTLKRKGNEVSLERLLELDDEEENEALIGFPVSAESPLDDALASERMRLLRKVLEELPSQLRRCVLLQINMNMERQEIAFVMKISITTVERQLSRAKRQLKQKLANVFKYEGRRV